MRASGHVQASKGLQVPANRIGTLVFTAVMRRNGQVKRTLTAAFGVAVSATIRDQAKQRSSASAWTSNSLGKYRRHFMVQKVTRALLTLALLVGALIAAPTSATAAETCSGTRIALITHHSLNTGKVVAHTGVFDRGSNRFCVRTVKSGVLYGTPTSMSLIIYSASSSTLLGRDVGRFYEYAGPLNFTTSSCFEVNLGMLNRADEETVNYRGTFC